MFLASTTVTIETASADTDDAGYPDRAHLTAAVGVPAHFGNRGDVVEVDSVDMGQRVRHGHRVLLPRGTTVAKGDRLVDAAGRRWVVDHVHLDHDALGVSPVRCDVTVAGEVAA